MTQCMFKNCGQSQAEFTLVKVSMALRVSRLTLRCGHFVPRFKAWWLTGEHAPCRAW